MSIPAERFQTHTPKSAVSSNSRLAIHSQADFPFEHQGRLLQYYQLMSNCFVTSEVDKLTIATQQEILLALSPLPSRRRLIRTELNSNTSSIPSCCRYTVRRGVREIDRTRRATDRGLRVEDLKFGQGLRVCHTIRAGS